MEKIDKRLKQRVVQELEKLPPEKLGEVLDFVVFLGNRTTLEEIHIPAPFLPVSHLDGLVGLVTWGGDALAESERFYDGNSLKAVTSQKVQA